jgi:hypothetical protein
MKKAKVGAARAPAKKGVGKQETINKARPSGAPGQGPLIKILERLARSTKRLAHPAEQMHRQYHALREPWKTSSHHYLRIRCRRHQRKL